MATDAQPLFSYNVLKDRWPNLIGAAWRRQVLREAGYRVSDNERPGIVRINSQYKALDLIHEAAKEEISKLLAVRLVVDNGLGVLVPPFMPPGGLKNTKTTVLYALDPHRSAQILMHSNSVYHAAVFVP